MASALWMQITVSRTSEVLDDLADASIMATLTPARRVAYQAFFECRRNNLQPVITTSQKTSRSFLLKIKLFCYTPCTSEAAHEKRTKTRA